jgi:uncharacterized protein YwqG
MPLIAQLALDEMPMPVIKGEGLLQLFYCTREQDNNPCDTMLDGWEPFSECHVARLVSASPGGTVPDVESPFQALRVTSWRDIDDYPDWQELADLRDGAPYDHFEGFPIVGEKLGGWPAWVQGPEYPSCPQCGARMEVVLQIDSEQSIAIMWGDVGIGHVTQCPNDPEVLTFAWACS